MTRNRLHEETSPYLLQHRANPVHWQAWGPDALELARSTQRPILLSIGYAACHWCHVMAHESFEDPACANIMNELFVNIKVDREERPDIDAIYQSALVFLGQQGGWPLTMFLTPEGTPFWGGTYFPNPARYGRPGFPDLLRRVNEIFQSDPDTVKQNCEALGGALDRLAKSPTPGALSLQDLDAYALRSLEDMDPVHGGTLGAPKFPRPFLYEFLWRGFLRSGDARLKTAVTVSLDNICQGGIYDHLGGGFSRYSTDERWLAPHFEKMLYDNGSLLEVLRLVWQETRSPLYESRIRETINWLLREMVADGGGFAASLDADSEGVEGRFYVWSADEISDLLGPDADKFNAIYDVTRGGNWEETNILNRLSKLALEPAEVEADLADCRRRLLDGRAQRERPGWDDKVLADWNGLAIRSLALAGQTFGEPMWIDTAKAAYQFIVEHMSSSETPDRLYHSFRAGQANHTAVLDDYVNMTGSALGLHEVTGDPTYLAHAQAWIDTLDRHYLDAENGGYFFTADDAEALITRTRAALDNASPSGNGAVVGWLARLYHLTGEVRYRDRADEIISAFAGDAPRMFHSLQSLMNGFEDLASPVQVAVIGARTHPDTAALLGALQEFSLPHLVLSVVTPGDPLPANHPATGKPQNNSVATAYVCVGTTCSLPITSIDDLRTQLRAAVPSSAHGAT